MTQENWGYLAKKMWGPIGLSDEFFSQGEWELFGIVWKWATKQEWWVKFITYALNHEADPIDGIKVSDFCTQLVEPTRFPELIVDFLQEKGEGDGAANND